MAISRETAILIALTVTTCFALLTAGGSEPASTKPSAPGFPDLRGSTSGSRDRTRSAPVRTGHRFLPVSVRDRL